MWAHPFCIHKKCTNRPLVLLKAYKIQTICWMRKERNICSSRKVKRREAFLRFIRLRGINPAIAPFAIVHHIPALSFFPSFSSSISCCHLSFSPSSPGLQLSQYAVTLFLSPACGGRGAGWMWGWGCGVNLVPDQCLLSRATPVWLISFSLSLLSHWF